MNAKQMATEALKAEKENIEDFWSGFQGDHTPFQYMEKVGAVLNRKNRERLEQIKSLAQEVIDSAEPQEPEQESVSNADIARMVKEELETEIARLKGKV